MYNPEEFDFIGIKITEGNYSKYCKDFHVPVGDFLVMSKNMSFVHLWDTTLEPYDYICESEEEFDHLYLQLALEN